MHIYSFLIFYINCSALRGFFISNWLIQGPSSSIFTFIKLYRGTGCRLFSSSFLSVINLWSITISNAVAPNNQEQGGSLSESLSLSIFLIERSSIPDRVWGGATGWELGEKLKVLCPPLWGVEGRELPASKLKSALETDSLRSFSGSVVLLSYQVAKLLLLRRIQEGSLRGFRFQINRCAMVMLREIYEGFVWASWFDPVQEPVLDWVIIPAAIIATSGFSWTGKISSSSHKSCLVL